MVLGPPCHIGSNTSYGRQFACIENLVVVRAAVTIQRGFRGWKGIPGPKSGPPPTSPVFGGPATTNVDVIKMDFDTYLQNRRPGSTVQSEGSLPSRTSGPVDGVSELAPVNQFGSDFFLFYL